MSGRPLIDWGWIADHLDDIVRLEAPDRGFSEDVVRSYLTKHVEFDLTPPHLQGLELFWRYVSELNG